MIVRDHPMGRGGFQVWLQTSSSRPSGENVTPKGKSGLITGSLGDIGFATAKAPAGLD
jgi:hypothetical protein